MKRVLVLNGDTYVGRHVVKAFHQSQEYDVEITRAKSDARRAAASRASAMANAHGWMWDDALTRESAPPSPDNARKKKRLSSTAATNNNANNNNNNTSAAVLAQQWQEEIASLPADIQHCVCGVVPKHNDNTEEFRLRLLRNDVVIAVLEDDAYEATCAIRILESTHYEVEKTFVLVSSALTWAYTLESERARARLTRQRERAEARDNFLSELLDEEGEGGDDDDDESAAAAAARAERRAARRRELEQRLPPSLRDPLPGEDEEEICELVPDRVFTEDGYAQRVPHPRFQHWHALEHLVKRANTQTLHTYVVFAGLPYGAGEGETMLYGLLRGAWYHQALLQYGPGTNALPMIHVHDLAAILFKLGNSYDTLEERYLFAVDQGKVTQRQLLQAVQSKLGGTLQPATSGQHQLLDPNQPTVHAAASAMAAAGTSASASVNASSSAGLAGSGTATHHTMAPAGTTAHSTMQGVAHAPPNGTAAAAVASVTTTINTTTTNTTTTGAAAAAVAVSANLVRLDRLLLPLPVSSADLFRVFGNEPCWGDGGVLLSTFALSDIQAEPVAVLNVHPAEEWVALEGFTTHLDLVLCEFREARQHMFRPVRTLITGPPLSGADTLAALVARQSRATFLTMSTIVHDYASHIAQVREALRVLLVRRLSRRRARAQARRVQKAVAEERERRAEQARKRQEKLAARRKKQHAGKGGEEDANEDDGGSDDEDAGAHSDDEDREGGDKENADSDNESLNSSISIFVPRTADVTNAHDVDGEHDDVDDEDGDGGHDSTSADRNAHASAPPHRAPQRPAELVVDEAYIRGPAGAVGDEGAGDAEGNDDGEAGMIDEEQEEEGEDVAGEDGGGATWLSELEERDAERQAELMEGQDLLPENVHFSEDVDMPRFAARRRGRAFVRDVDRQELRCVAALRREYLLGLRVLALKVSSEDGRLPRPPPPQLSDDEEADDDAAEGRGNTLRGTARGPTRGAGKGRANVGEDEEQSEGEHDREERSDAGSSEQGRDGDHNGNTKSGGHANADADAEADDDDDDDDLVKSSAADTHANVLVAADPSLYLDAALAVMFRWRLRQPDCRCQGYVLSNFPQNLTQAVLCFKANETELEDQELRRQRALAPLLASADDHAMSSAAAAAEGGAAGADDADADEAPLPPPLDEDFALPDIANMDDEQLRAVEAAHRRSRDVAAAPQAGVNGAESAIEEAAEPEEIMAPVDEAIFVDHVVCLQANMTLLKSAVEVLQTTLATQPDTNAEALDALRTFLSASPFARRLETYSRHHSPTAPPTQSLLAWLRAVTTTPALGARPAPVVVPLSDPSNSTSAAAAPADDGEGNKTATTTLEAPPTTRTAEVVSLAAPVLSAAEVQSCWCAVFDTCRRHPSSAHAAANTQENADEAWTLLQEKLPMALLRLAPLFWTGGGDGGGNAASQQHAVPSSTAPPSQPPRPPLPSSLFELRDVLCARLVPSRRLAACGGGGGGHGGATHPAGGGGLGGARTHLTSLSTASTNNSTGEVAAGPSQVREAAALTQNGDVDADFGNKSDTLRERLQLSDLERREAQIADMATKEGAAEVQQERTALRKLQLAEESGDAAALLRMPAEAYLMKYVLPSLTPAMTEVVRTRADDPVTALANVLFDYKRQTTI